MGTKEKAFVRRKDSVIKKGGSSVDQIEDCANKQSVVARSVRIYAFVRECAFLFGKQNSLQSMRNSIYQQEHIMYDCRLTLTSLLPAKK